MNAKTFRPPRVVATLLVVLTLTLSVARADSLSLHHPSATAAPTAPQYNGAGVEVEPTNVPLPSPLWSGLTIFAGMSLYSLFHERIKTSVLIRRR